MMKKKILATIVLGLGITLAQSAIAQNTNSVLAKIKQTYPNLQVEKVNYLPDIKLYELILKGNRLLTYTNEDVSFFVINGEIVNPKTKENIAKDRTVWNIKDFYNSLPYDKAISIKYGKGTRGVAIFTDPDCPFCKVVDKEIHEKLTKQDVTIHYFFNPLNIPGHEEAPLKAAKIWCAKDRPQAFKDWMLNGKLPNNNGKCENPVAATKELSTQVGFNSTPTLVFDSGYVWKGQITSDAIMEVFQKNPIK